MLIVTGLLDVETLGRIREIAAGLTWQDGVKTAGREAARVKKNEQADLSFGPGRKLAEELAQTISAHSVVKAAAQPGRFSKLLLSRTGPGGKYGFHIDNAIMGHPTGKLRTDLSFTLFLSDPEDYEGGALAIETAGETRRVKSKAGDLVLYPTTSLHAVEEVTGGERLVCVGWIESLIRRADQRDVLFDLENLRASLRTQLDPDAVELKVLSKSIANLIRLWAET